MFMPVIMLITFISLIFSLFSFGFYFATSKYLQKLKIWTVFLFPLIIVMSCIFGTLTIKIHSGFGSSTDFIDAVKMGYPIFWLEIFLGTYAFLISKTGLVSRN